MEAGLGARARIVSGVLGWLRVMLTFGVIGLIVVLAIGPRVRDEMDETFLGVGQELLHQPRTSLGERTLVLNGHRMRVTTGSTERTLGEVLDRFEDRCHDADGVPSSPMLDFLESPPKGQDGPDPTIRAERGQGGYAACIDVGSDDLEPSGWRSKIEAFARTVDIDQLGRFRYLYAEGGERTFFVALESEGPFRLREMFPETGDVGGDEPRDVPRPPASQRILAAHEEGQPFAVRAYVSEQLTATQLERHYRAEMPRRGWRALETGRIPEGQPLPEHAVVYEMPSERELVGRLVFLVFRDRESGGFTTMLEAE